jgi:hypothetical protein
MFRHGLRGRAALFVLLTALVAPAPAIAAPEAATAPVVDQAVPPEHARPRMRKATPEELKRAGLEHGTGICAGTFQFKASALGNGPKLCSHGPDVVEAAPADGAAEVLAAAPTTPGIPCYSSTSTSLTVEVVYLYPGADNAVLRAKRKTQIKETTAIADYIYNQSAKQVSGSHIRHVPWLMSSCQLSVKAISVPAAIFYDFFAVHENLISRGELKANEKMLAWHEAGGCGGLGQFWSDETAGSGNDNNAGSMLGWVDTGCLDWGDEYVTAAEVAAHELGHTLGAVQYGAPHSSQAGHCWDESDIMCYADGGSHPLEARCAVRIPELMDCNKDDYFHTGAASGYLATHWNTAKNRFLKTVEPPSYEVLPRPTVSISSPAPGSAIAGSATVTATAAAPAGSTIKSVEFVVNGEAIGYDDTAPFQLPLETLQDFEVAAAYPNGTKLAIVAKATDTVGRSKTSAAATYTVSNPTVRLISPTYGSRTSGTAFWSAIASAGLGRTISKVDFLVNGVVRSTDTTAPYNGTWNASTFGNGAYLEVAARVTDSGGVQRTGPVRAINVEGPTVNLVNPSYWGGMQYSRSTTFVADAKARWGATITKVEFLVEGVPGVACTATTYPYACTYTPATPTELQVRARATDSTGGVTTSEATTNYVQAHPSDTVTVTSPASGASVPRTSATTLTATHSSSAARVATGMDFYVDGSWVGSDVEASDGWTVSWTPATYSSMPGIHTIVAVATIANGGSSYTAYSAALPVIVSGGPSTSVNVPSTTVGKTVNVSATVSGGGTVNSVAFFVNGEMIDWDFDGSNGWSVPWDTRNASDGFLALRAVAETANGQAVSEPRYVSLLNMYATVTAPANGATVSGTYQLKAFATGDPEGAVEWVKWYVDGVHIGSDSTPAYTLNWNSATVADGSHTVKARVFLSDGRWRDSATWTFNVNN